MLAGSSASRDTASVTSHQLAMDSQFVERALVIAPMLAHLDEEIQKNMAAEKLFDLGASRCANLFKPRAALPNDYRAMRRPLLVGRGSVFAPS